MSIFKSLTALVLVSAVPALAPLPAAAHHSTAMFEWGKVTKINGIVERFDWTNPHVFLFLKGADGKRYAFEGMSPNHLGRHGWSKRSVSPGDKVAVGYYKLKDGRDGGFCVTVTLPDGTRLAQLPNIPE